MVLQKKVIKHIPLEDLQYMISKENNKHIYQRLLFIHLLYKDFGVEKACKTMCLSKQTGYNWLEQWNKQGYEGVVPDFGGGRPPKLDKDRKEQLKEKLRTKDNWITSEVRALIRKEFGVTYSICQVSRILRSFRMHYAKPYPQDYRRPENATELLAQSIKESLSNAPVDTVIGFLDEASPQTTDNKQRFWSFNKPRITKNTTKIRANTFGFYPMNGKEVIDFKENSKSPKVCEFLRQIREKNPLKHIVIFADNARSHIAQQTRAFAESLNITFILIPPYSPHLNPIEFIWKSIRRKISRIFVKSEWSFKETIRTTFHMLAKKNGFMNYWLDMFRSVLSNLL